MYDTGISENLNPKPTELWIQNQIKSAWSNLNLHVRHLMMWLSIGAFIFQELMPDVLGGLFWQMHEDVSAKHMHKSELMEVVS